MSILVLILSFAFLAFDHDGGDRHSRRRIIWYSEWPERRCFLSHLQAGITSVTEEWKSSDDVTATDRMVSLGYISGRQAEDTTQEAQKEFAMAENFGRRQKLPDGRAMARS